jgi:hypothetical protein
MKVCMLKNTTEMKNYHDGKKLICSKKTMNSGGIKYFFDNKWEHMQQKVICTRSE